MSPEHGAGTIEVIHGNEQSEVKYSDPKSFVNALESSPEFQEIHDRYIAERPGTRREVEENFLDSNAYKEAVSQFVEAGNVLRYDPGQFFRSVPRSQTSLVREFQHGLQEYFQTSVGVRRYARAGVHEEASRRSLEKMDQHDNLASLLQQMGVAPGKSAARQLVRLIAIDKGYDTEESLRMGDIQRRRTRVEQAAVVHGR